MSPFRNQLKTPEEIELEKKRAELSRLKAECAARESDFLYLKAQIRIFEQLYANMLGARIALLEDLEWQLNGMLDDSEADETAASPVNSDAFAYFHHRTDLLDDDLDVDADPTSPPRNLKSLYRAVAKAIHPDLAPDEEQRLRRQELMAIANHAYEVGDRKVLEDIYFDWEQGPEIVSEQDVAMELVRVIREIARMQQNIHALGCQIEELKATDICNFKIRVDESLSDGIDLLAEMAAALDLDITKAKNRLAVLRGDGMEAGERSGTPLETRIIRFPVETSCGIIFERNKHSLDFRDWHRVGIARGAKEVYLDKSVRLDVKCAARSSLSFLETLQGDDLQALFLYDAADAALKHLAHLTALEELYLSNATVSDNGLRLLTALKGLKRLYIYHTGITDNGLLNLIHLSGLKSLTCSGTGITETGLDRFRQLMPGCKVINFKWRYDQ
ncbi:MAG: hypothetical protein M0T70_08960 [Geobacteraceae bacterium]|nr:hypothetical protein [Geobacteraceae bacterium]